VSKLPSLGQAAGDQRLELVYWRTRVFRNSYVRAGKLHRVRGWSAKIQHQGVRRTISLGAVDQEVAAEKAAAIFAQIQQSGWASLGQAVRPTMPVVATGQEADDPRESVDYWRLRLVVRKYPAKRLAKPEFSCRIEQDGAGCYFPLGTLNEVQAAEQALEVYRCVVVEGWEAAVRFRRELTLALIWSGSPFCCTYLTIHSLPGKTKTTVKRPKTDPDCLNNLALDPVFLKVTQKYRDEMDAFLKKPAIPVRMATGIFGKATSATAGCDLFLGHSVSANHEVAD